jgi:hypothetical protein
MAVTDELPRRRRVARLSLFAVALIALTLILLAVAAWIALREDPGTSSVGFRSAPTTTSRPSR